MPRLSYSGDREVRETPGAQMQALVDDLVAVERSESPVTVDIAQVRPLGAGWLVSVSLSAEAPLGQLVDLEDTLAQATVEVGLEVDVPTAKEKITIS
jgi:hypothetical protein